MLKLKTDRAWRKADYTIGRFFVNGTRFHESLEDADRGLDQTMSLSEISSKKIYGVTAIPRGTYKVILSVSPKFKNKSWAAKYGGLVPEIIGVKGYSGVRIHPLNDAKDSQGCIGIGDNKVTGKIVNSVKCYEELMAKFIFPAWTRKEEITIEIL